MLLVSRDHLLHRAAAEHVGQENREGLVAHQLPGAPDRMAQPQGLLLAGEAGVARLGLVPGQELQLLGLAAGLQRPVELIGDVEVILDHRLVAAGDEDEMLDAGGAGLVHHVLHHGAVDDAEHLLGNGFGGREEPGSEAGDGKDCFADALH
jgi:hypothetical protein